MAKYSVVFESPTKWDAPFIHRYLKQKVPVWIVEPFQGYHHKKFERHLSPPLPAFAKKLIQNNKVSLLKVEKTNAREMYSRPNDKAIEVVELVYPQYRKDHQELFQYVSDTLKTSESENVFRKNLCANLAEFYSLNTTLHKIVKMLGTGPVLFYSDADVSSYIYCKALLSRSGQEYFEHSGIRFSWKSHIRGFGTSLKKCFLIMGKLIAQTIASGLLGGGRSFPSENKKDYLYGVAIVSPLRQLIDSRRAADFIIDNDKIMPEDVVYFASENLNDDQKKKLEDKPGEIFYMSKSGRCFSHFSEWKKLLGLALKKNFFKAYMGIEGACTVFYYYFYWQEIMKGLTLRHFITYCDFGLACIGRDIALNQAGVQTWYYSNSSCQNTVWKDTNKYGYQRHPYWTYLNYDHLVTWNETLAQYHKKHPRSFKQVHVIGCLWNENIDKRRQVKKMSTELSLKNLQDYFVLAVFDTNYFPTGNFLNYEQGLVFTKYILQLADSHPDIYVFLKEKASSNFRLLADPNLGAELIDCYNKMSNHPRISICPYQVNATELISASDMVISFPYSSTTHEALSMNKPGIWHDPVDCLNHDIPWGESFEGLITHGYDELNAKVLEIKNMKPGTYKNPIPTGSPLIDPYRDGKALERFRDLLVSN